MRTVLTAATTFYVDPNGSDTNDGRTSVTAWQTLQHAWDALQAQYDLGGQSVTVQVAAGVYRSGLTARGIIAGQSGPTITFTGNQSNPDSVIVSPYAGNPFSAAYGATYSINGIAVDSQGVPATPQNPNGGADLIAVGQQSTIRIRNVTFYYGVGNGHIAVAFGGNLVVDQPGYTIKGGGQYHISAGAGGTVYFNTDGRAGLISVSVLNTPTFTAGFACANGCAVVNAQAIGFNGGAAHGPTYLAKNNGIIDTRSGGNVNYFPGDIAGHCESGGQYT